jgi:two-component system LytT family sensor kinase
MRSLIENPSEINKIEYWAVTTWFVFTVFFLITRSVNSHWEPRQSEFENVHQQYSYSLNYFFPTLIQYITFYASYCLLTFLIIPSLSIGKNIAWNIIFITIIFSLISIVLDVTGTWKYGYLFGKYSKSEAYAKILQDSIIYSLWLMMIFGLYNGIKFLAIYLLENYDLIQSKYIVINRDAIYAFIIWMIGLFVLVISKADTGAIIVLSMCSLAAIFLYCYSIQTLIPEIYRNHRSFKSFLLRFIIVAFLISISLLIIVYVLVESGNEGLAFITSFSNMGFQLLFTAPLSWYVYKHRMDVNYEIKGLKTALGRSTANLNFLRSQINPHFLFNALNTLYATALQEKGERTAEGIQKLGDMMRFMLHENVQDKISLNREIEYLNNYITLQTLRTQSSPDIVINREIEEHAGNLQIAPMLLIPFVENAFKHGISLKEPSHIRISLISKENTLFFDVSNSIHHHTASDPEKDNNGIGMNNVKQRLQLLYPNKHELAIHENGKEFFIHLTIELD